ncbi:MAG: anthranilate phosphoribosyltransferase [Chloroflexi bacterium]|nr:anthranilate phosphoribosyltransferase [Chloroflexota bacterium]MCI0580620.1 anthranilate phosphoribosyltransferase [Chloroflexota bacterium]MCI0649716.1 anthranilate phosphoribosyltransferase [Chloroflexota bacterium]MCI0727764.1 anthranilate phosphoribosyltransferase [Chloroflexota bacterium]
MPLKAAIAEVINGRHLSMDQAEAAMNVIMRGEATPAQIGSYLTALRMKGETVEEIAGSARAMRTHVVRVDVPLGLGGMLVDTCGTGGDGKHTFNISTTAAFVVAGYGLKVAKHGNRAASSQCGSADVLMALGGNLDLTPEQVAECIQEVGIGFLYAVNHHPAMRHAIGPRREIGQRTIFNVLGPLTNPAGATHQLMGVYDPVLTEPLAHVLDALGSKAAYVVHGADGLDELSTTGVNRASRLANGEVTSFDLDPETLGLGRTTLEQLQGGPPEINAQITRDILTGQDRGPRRDIVLLNAAAALSLTCDDWAAGLAEASESIDSGAARYVLDAWVDKTNRFRRKA